MRRPDLSQLTHAEKDSLIYELLDRVSELERRLGLDSSNSSKPPSSDGYKKKPRPTNLREKTDKNPGGQPGHVGKNLQQVEHPDKIVDHHPAVCVGCGHALGREDAKDYRKRQVFDVPPPTPVQVTEHRAHRCHCPQCGEITESSFPQDVTAPTQYGPNVTALVVYFQNWHLIPEDRLADLMLAVFGVHLSTATIAAMARRTAGTWAGLARHIGELVKKAAVKHMDETGYRIAKALHWLHVASTGLLTFYRTVPKRGTMLDGVSGIVVHDFWGSYFKIPGVTHGLCNAHHLRELKALVDIEKEEWALAMYRFLRQICHAINLAHERKKPIKPSFLHWISQRYDRILAQGVAFHESLPPPETPQKKRRGRKPRRTGHNLVERLRDHKDMVLLFLTNPDVPFTNNQAERDIRMMKLRQKISGCFRSEAGAQTFAAIRTILSTAQKQGWNVFHTLATHPEDLIQKLKTA